MTRQQLEALQNRRMASQDRFLSRQEKLEKLAEPLIGELTREGKKVYYINLTKRDGTATGKTKESHSFFELVDYLDRNKYIVVR